MHAQAASPLSTAFPDRLGALAARTEALLERLLSQAPQPGEIARPARLLEAMRHGALGGGKRLRPFLAVEAARLLGQEGDGPLRAGAGVELLHCYSLVHDDLPAMDDDDLRRGRPTVHKAYDEATAILAGDALQTLAFEVMADPETDPDGAVRAELVLGLARAAGLGGMAGGQMLDLAAEGRYGRVDLDEAGIRTLQAMKTGAILAFAVEAGAIIGRADAAARAALLAYGRGLGAAFQIADDILDRESTTEALGKAAGKDAAAGKGTLVDRLGLEGAKREAARLLDATLAALDGFGPEAETLREAARFTVARSS
ncbi:polyprenyl synthetase family protein [Salinarimonas soli]|uniref:Probable farnesyl diphosphate synthase n=1 Tax=Salinarimonas soli TaxID=1638099 RepID=A0A5B2VV43_9HYPH|nr:polyprenyl synthetase family protein [Salinarimonas soli]